MAGSGLLLPAVSPAAAVTDPEPDFTVDLGDLEFILRQIRISEHHAAGGPLVCADPADLSDTCVPNRRLPFGLRTVDGRDNNLFPGRRDFGAAQTPFKRRVTPRFDDADSGPFGPGGSVVSTSYAQKRGVVVDADPRRISNLIVDQTTQNPAAVAAAQDVAGSTTDAEGNIYIPDVSPDEGLSAPFNSWFTLFGQFFDHGLDLVAKGGSGVVLVPLEPGDDLYDPESPTNFIPLTRATNQPGADGILGTADDVQEHKNLTTPFVDQNQTYTSHASHQVFLREYRLDDAGRPVPTGHLLDGADGGLATWAEVKAQARDLLGIELDDLDVLNVPMVLTDPYGHFIPDGDGMPQLVVPGATPTTPAGRLSASLADPVDASQAIRVNTAFLDDIAHAAAPVSGADGQPDPTAYDAALLGSHFITGDGRGNENIGLTAVHHVFHSEHNRVADQIDELIAATGGEVEEQWRSEELVWDYGERLFQAARFVTEMEYQHLVFEEFGRTVAPTIDVGPLNESLYHADVDPRIVAEFAHVVYRFGHSMLTDTVDRDGHGAESLSLFDAFLNPAAFTDGGRMTPDQGAGAVIRGMVAQTGNGIDEFVVDTLRNKLLGVGLDLAAFNLARGRETGVPPLQSARRALYAESRNPAVRPYDDWEDFRLALKHRASIVNFVAAYGVHPSLAAATTDAERREAAEALVATDAFMHGDPAATGLDAVDFWIGGLAERPQVFGGMLGTTFNLIFEEQLEDLQNGDRFYYLTRLQGLNLLGQLEANSFAELIRRNTDVGSVPANVFAAQDAVIELADLAGLAPGDAGWPQGLVRLADGTYRFDGPEHVAMYGTPADDRMRGGDGDDALWGHEDADRIEGDIGNDVIHGNAGDDVLTDIFGDDVIHAGAGNDAINPGPGLDLVFGQAGQDFILHGEEPTESFAGAGSDLVRGSRANDVITGNEHDDWLEGNQGHDLVQGDNALTFQNDPKGGADVLIGGSGNDDHDAEGGDDVMLNNGVDRHAGMLGFDWVTHQGDPDPVDTDLALTVFLPPNVQLLRSRFMNVEGLSGWTGDDVLRGRDKAGDQANEDGSGHELTQAHLDRVIGLRDLLGGGATPPYAAAFFAGADADEDAADILLGGEGSDLIQGRAGDDVIDGDAWLQVRITGPNGLTASSMTEVMNAVFDGELSAADLAIERRIVVPEGQSEVVDTAYYSGTAADHEVSENPDGTVRVSGPDGTDTLRRIERLVFEDGSEVDLTEISQQPAEGTVSLDDTTPTEDQELTATVAATDANGIPADVAYSFTWQSQAQDGTWAATPGGVEAAFTPGDAEVGRALRVVVTFQDGAGATETLVSEPTEPVANVNDAPTPPEVQQTAPRIGTQVDAVAPLDDDGIPGAVTYTWQRGQGGAWTTVGTGASYQVAQADGGERLRVVARFTDGHGTEEVIASTPTEVVPAWVVPAAPTVGALSPGIGSISAAWSGPDEADNAPVTSYVMAVRRNGADHALVTGLSPAQTTATLDVPDGSYRVRIAAVNAVGQGAWSAWSEAAVVSPVDVEAPTVVAQQPAAGATGVAVGANVSATFSEDVTGVDAASFTLTPVGGGAPVAATVSMATPRRAVLDPTAALASDTAYDVALTDAVVDGVGNPLAPVTWRFRTRDVVRPTVTATSPAAGATGVSQNPLVRVTFSEPVVGVNGTTLTLARGAAAVPASVTYDAATRTATLDPVGLLAADRLHTVRVTSGIADASGNSLVARTVTFTTGNTAAPAVIARTTGVVPVRPTLRVTLSEPVRSVAAANVRLRVQGRAVPVRARLVDGRRALLVTPQRALPRDRRVVVRVLGLRDSDGRPMRATGWVVRTRR
ncbi:hypothetical protein GCM10027425_20990 [Alteromonas gracilis]